MEIFSIKGKALVFEVRWARMFTAVLLTATKKDGNQMNASQ